MVAMSKGVLRFTFSVSVLHLCVSLLLYVAFRPVPVPVSVTGAPIGAPVSTTEFRPAPRVAVPSRLVVDSLKIDMPVQRASFDTTSEQWTDNGLDASYAEESVPLNNSNGNTLIFAHAQWGAFAALPSIELGALASVYGEKGERYEYVAREIRQVLPSDVGVFSSLGSPRLVLQTCSGPWDSHRTLVYFDFVRIVA